MKVNVIQAWNCRVLIVDDQEEIHNDFKEMLAPEAARHATDDLAKAFMSETDTAFLPRFELFHATSGEEACEMVKAGKEAGSPFALAFVDIRMPPGVNGIETVRRIRKFEHDIEMVIMTAYSDKTLPEIVSDMVSLHKLLYIRKPFSREEIQQITLSLVGKWNNEQELAESRHRLEISHQRLAAVLDATGDAIGMFDADGRLQVANREYESLIGAPETELKQMQQADFMARVETRLRPAILPEWGRRPFLDGKGEVEEEITEGSKPRLLYRSRVPVRDGQQNPMGHITVYRDVSTEVEKERMRAEVLQLRNVLMPTCRYGGIIGQSKAMQDVYALMERAAESDITVLLQGESGTGKELVSRLIHDNSPRKQGPFVAVNCAAISETLIESELFGHERAFTGAATRRAGQLERAQGGTVLLDEIGHMPMALQGKLLRVLQEREIQRVGGTATIPIDIRVIAATNRDLQSAVKVGEFRADLYYRLAAFTLIIPPLREHREDIPLLVAHFLRELADGANQPVRGISPAALQQLLVHDWPGNVRELRSAIERALLPETTERPQVGSFPPQLANLAAAPVEPEASVRPVLSLQAAERQALVHALAVSDRNVTRAAQVLNVNRTTLYRKLKKHRLTGTKPGSKAKP